MIDKSLRQIQDMQHGGQVPGEAPDHRAEQEAEDRAQFRRLHQYRTRRRVDAGRHRTKFQRIASLCFVACLTRQHGVRAPITEGFLVDDVGETVGAATLPRGGTISGCRATW